MNFIGNTLSRYGKGRFPIKPCLIYSFHRRGVYQIKKGKNMLEVQRDSVPLSSNYLTV